MKWFVRAHMDSYSLLKILYNWAFLLYSIFIVLEVHFSRYFSNKAYVNGCFEALSCYFLYQSLGTNILHAVA